MTETPDIEAIRARYADRAINAFADIPALCDALTTSQSELTAARVRIGELEAANSALKLEISK